MRNIIQQEIRGIQLIGLFTLIAVTALITATFKLHNGDTTVGLVGLYVVGLSILCVLWVWYQWIHLPRQNHVS